MEIPLLPGSRPDGSVDPGVARRVARAWLAGALVGLPTETVYGLSADAQDARAVARIYRAKGRPADHPLIVHVSGPQAIAGWSFGPNRVADHLAAVFWPGALTVVVRRGDRAGDFVTGGQDTVALRCPDHPVAVACLRALAAESGDPARGVAAPSANRFGRVSPTRATDVLAELGAHLDPRRDLVVDGGPCRIGVESTIVDCTWANPRVLRLGAISQKQVDQALSACVTIGDRAHGAGPPAERVPAAHDSASGVRAPGNLAAHYAPQARVVLVEADEMGPPGPDQGSLSALGAPTGDGPVGLIADGALDTPPGWTRLLAPTSALEFAHGLYAALRGADQLGLNLVVAVLPDPQGGALATAVRDRLARAAHTA